MHFADLHTGGCFVPRMSEDGGNMYVCMYVSVCPWINEKITAQVYE